MSDRHLRPPLQHPFSSQLYPFHLPSALLYILIFRGFNYGYYSEDYFSGSGGRAEENRHHLYLHNAGLGRILKGDCTVGRKCRTQSCTFSVSHLSIIPTVLIQNHITQAVVVMVESASDVSQVLNFCRAKSVDFTVAGGRHSSGGASSLEGGVIIDLSKMRAISVDPAAKTCKVQGGATWAEVDSALGEHGLATVGGTVNHTGVGGLTLGGGYGWLASWYGLTIDNLLAATMVLADGRVVTTSETEEPDLFWAIRGAGQSFGVAVDFTFKCHDQKNTIWAGNILIPAEGNLDTIADFVNHVCKVTTGEAAVYVNVMAPPFLDNKPTLGAACYYNGPTEKALEFFAPLLKLNHVHNDTREMPYSEMNSIFNNTAVGPFGNRKVIKGNSTAPYIRREFLEDVIKRVVELGQRIPDAAASTIIFEFAYTKGWTKTAQTATAFANRGDFNNCAIVGLWKDAANDELCRQWAREMAEIVGEEFKNQKAARNMGGDDAVGQYLNYDGTFGTETLKPLYENSDGGLGVGGFAQAMFGVNYDRLVKLKKIYDPENLFNRSYLFV